MSRCLLLITVLVYIPGLRNLRPIGLSDHLTQHIIALHADDTLQVTEPA